MRQVTPQPDYENETPQSGPLFSSKNELKIKEEERREAEADAEKVAMDAERAKAEAQNADAERQRREAEPKAKEGNATNLINAESAVAINKRIGDLGSQIEILTKVVGEQSELQKDASIEVRGSVEQTIAALNARIDELKTEYNEKNKVFRHI